MMQDQIPTTVDDVIHFAGQPLTGEKAAAARRIMAAISKATEVILADVPTGNAMDEAVALLDQAKQVALGALR